MSADFATKQCTPSEADSGISALELRMLGGPWLVILGGRLTGVEEGETNIAGACPAIERLC
jgi:hypothetical protein